MAIDDQFRLLTGDERFCLHGKDLNFQYWIFGDLNSPIL